MLNRKNFLFCILVAFLALAAVAQAEPVLVEYNVPSGSHPHDVAPAADGGIWYTAQGLGALGHLDPKSGKTRHIPLGEDSSPHGVVVGPDGSPWITDTGLNAIVRVDAATGQVTHFPLPWRARRAHLNTPTFDNQGQLWFTGQAGYYGRVILKTGKVEVFKAPFGRGPYGICTTPGGVVYYASLAGSHIARIDSQSGIATVIKPPVPGQGARRVWADSRGRIWISEWQGGKLGLYDPGNKTWREWVIPGPKPKPYAVYVDNHDLVWLSDFGQNSLVRFDPATNTFTAFPLPSKKGSIRQIHGRPGEVWGAESRVDKLIVLRTP